MTTDHAGQQSDAAAIAGVIARPPFLFLGALLVGFVLDYLLPLPFAVPGAAPMRWLLGGAMIIAGIAFMGGGFRGFTQAGTPVPTNQPTTALVTSGIHGWTRNPIYVGMFLIYLGIGIAAASQWILMLVVPIAVVMRYGVVAREEAYLERRFGDAYRDYKRRVRRWL